MGPWSRPARVPTVGHVPLTPTNRLYPLPDGSDLTWSHVPIQNAVGAVVFDQHTDGHLDGRPIDDDELGRLLTRHGLR